MIAALAALTTTDLWFWDDALPAGDGVGAHLPDGRVVLRWDPSKDAYEAAPIRTATLGAVAAVTAPGEAHPVQDVTVTLVPGAPLSASVVAGPAARLPTVPAGHPTPDRPVPIDTLAPFPVVVDYATASVVAAPAVLPKGFWPIVAGTEVTLAGARYTVGAIDGDALDLLGPTEVLHRVPNPDGRRLPSGYALAVALGAGAGLMRWRRA